MPRISVPPLPLRDRDRRYELFQELNGTGTKMESSGELIYCLAVVQQLLLGVVVARLLLGLPRGLEIGNS